MADTCVLTKAIEAFWNSQRNQPYFKDHPILSNPAACFDCSGSFCFGPLEFCFCLGALSIHCKTLRPEATDLSKTIPILIHGDDADSHRRRTFGLVTFGSAVCHGEFWDCRVPVYVVDNHQTTSETTAVLDTWLAYSLTELQCGHFLDRGPFGEELPDRTGLIAGGWRGVYVIHKGDEKWMQKCFKTLHSAVGNFVCIGCKATASGQGVYTEHGPTASHRATILSTESSWKIYVRSRPLRGSQASAALLSSRTGYISWTCL